MVPPMEMANIFIECLFAQAVIPGSSAGAGATIIPVPWGTPPPGRRIRTGAALAGGFHNPELDFLPA